MTTETPDIEAPEGMGNDEISLGREYPIDTMLIRTETRTIHDVLRRIDKGGFVMDPDFQRDFVWPEDKQSKLIESVLMRIPLPVFYLGEDEKGRMIVVDGLQRLSTFQRFFKNQLQLKLPDPDKAELDKKKFEDLPFKLQNRFEDCNLILYIIDAKAKERTRLDIFDRVNSGEPLTRQQMRNCLYNGKATRFLKEEASSEVFKQATGNSLNPRTMMDREFVNRFCAFQLLPLNNYKGDMDEWLGAALKAMEKLDDAALSDLSTRFRASLRNNYLLFGAHAFRKYERDQERRSVINASLWDVLSAALSRHSEAEVAAKAEELRIAFYALLQDEDFAFAITSGTSSVNHVQLRFQKMNDLLAEVFRAD